jgi:hypothetical protein
MTTVTETTPRMPSFDSPGDDWAHIAIGTGVSAYCGFKGPTPHRRHGGYRDGDTHCQCGAPMCPTCVDMVRAEHNGGIRP